ncbi:MAG: response regulator [Solirubrobacteraceae bacterium]
MAARAPIRVVVADDHPLFRDGLVRCMREREDVALLGEAADGVEALAQIRQRRPDVAVLDVKLPRLGGIAVCAEVTRERLPTRVLMLSAFPDGPLVYRALASGARGYLSKDVDRGEVCDAIHAAARGEIVVAAELEGKLAEQISARGNAERNTLTPREREILTLIASGSSAPEIGRRLHLSTGTVKTHLLRLYEKRGVSDRAAAVAEAMRSGLIE